MGQRIGIDVGGTNVKIALVSDEGKIISMDVNSKTTLRSTVIFIFTLNIALLIP